MTYSYWLKDKARQRELETALAGFAGRLAEACEAQWENQRQYVRVSGNMANTEWATWIKKCDLVTDNPYGGPAGIKRLRRLNDKGIRHILSYYERELRKRRYYPWPEHMFPPAPMALPPCPQLSRDWFEDVEEKEE